MITLEEQIRRYAIDVAGPAVGSPPADLDVVDRTHHRGRWVLVAALVVFIAGLTWVATRPTELGDGPAVDELGPPVTIPQDVVSEPAEERTCGDGGPVGVALDGPAGTGLCAAAWWMESPPELAPTEALMLATYQEGRPLGGSDISECGTVGFGGAIQPGFYSSPDLLVVSAQVPERTATARVLDGEGPTLVAFDLPGVTGSRFVVARAPDASWTGPMKVYDASGAEIGWSAAPCSSTSITRPSTD